MTKIYNILLAISLSVVMLLFPACEDRFEYNVGEFTEGMGSVKVQASFFDFTPELASRSAGDAIQTINSLTLFIYDTKGNPFTAGGTLDFPLKYSSSDLTREEHDASSDDRVSFNLTLPNGQYRMYALANMDIDIEKILLANRSEVFTEDLLFIATTPKWDEEDVRKNNQMFGRFDSNVMDSGQSDGEGGETSGAEAPMVVINGDTNLHVWLRRCASKLTLQYDGSNLYDGVSIYLMSATIKDIPFTCTLGLDNSVTFEEALLKQGEIIDYYDSDDIPTAGQFDSPVRGIVIKNKASDTNARVRQVWPPKAEDAAEGEIAAHSPMADALYFYENMQGYHENLDKRQQFKEGSTTELDYIHKDDVKCGTYLEVEAIYRADRVRLPDGSTYTSAGRIIYRFMLGKDIVHDFNAERNCHYKLTLSFFDKGNDVDWHIEYGEQVLTVTDPKIFDYQGRVFVPDGSKPNLNHNFTDENTIKVSSYLTSDMKLKEYTVTYDYDGKTGQTTAPSWLEVSAPKVGENPYDHYITYKVKPESTVCRKFTVADKFSKTQKGSVTLPYNLANPSQGSIDPKNATISSTSNCYIIDAPGYYLLPLVYGNAYENGAKNPLSYNPTYKAPQNLRSRDGSEESEPKNYTLDNFKDYLGNEITSPYIKDSGTPKNGMLIWEDEQDLIDYSIWHQGNPNIKYIKDAYPIGNNQFVGGLIFHIAEVKEGNAVVAVTDQDIQNLAQIFGGVEGNIYPPLPRSMWSWHIWVTGLFNGLEDNDKTIRVQGDDTELIYDLMPVNLGWCSEGEEISYYPERRCTVHFDAGNDKKEKIDIIQKSHIAVPRGNNPYYQWGRKDPFIGSDVKSQTLDENTGNRDLFNKTLYWGDGQWGKAQRNPTRYTVDLPATDTTLANNRKYTCDIISDLIQKPYIWQNPKREWTNYENWGIWMYASIDKTYFNLWDGDNKGVNDPKSAPLKTIYDPCPSGYQVPNYRAFSGFTSGGVDASDSDRWFDVLEDHVKDFSGGKWVKNDIYTDRVFEFYTTHDKYQSIVFPQLGYRDWDSHAYIYHAGKNSSIGYVWSAHLVGGNNHNRAYNFEFTRIDESTDSKYDKSYVRPLNMYFPCDGFPVRPCRQPKNRIQNGQY